MTREATPQLGTSDVAPKGFTSVAATGFPFHRAPRTEDGRHCWQVSWLAAQTLPLNLPNNRTAIASGISQVELAAYSCGGSHGTSGGPPVFPSRRLLSSRVDQHRQRSTGLYQVKLHSRLCW
ncbi:protein of unknown function [Hyphomicrobium sp. 1Nfss2.1]